MKKISIITYIAAAFLLGCTGLEAKNPCIAKYEWKVFQLPTLSLRSDYSKRQYFRYSTVNPEFIDVSVKLFTQNGIRREEDVNCDQPPRKLTPWKMNQTTLSVIWKAVGDNGDVHEGHGLRARFKPAGMGNYSITFDAKGMPETPPEYNQYIETSLVVPAASFDVNLQVEKNEVSLLAPNRLSLVFQPASAAQDVGTVDFVISRQNVDGLYVLSRGSSTSYTWKPTAAGHMRLTAQVQMPNTIAGVSGHNVDVVFPNTTEILAGAGVQAKMNQAWTNTINATTPTSRREEGYYLRLNTSNGVYLTTKTFVGRKVDNNSTPELTNIISILPDPLDTKSDPKPTDKLIYTVGWFHTHTPALYIPKGRPVGPSDKDFTFSDSYHMQMPGFAFDYIESGDTPGWVPGGHPINSPTMIYPIDNPPRRPLDRRTTFP